MRSIKNITLGLATVGVMSLSGCAGDYLDTIPSTSVSETTINTSLDNLYIALNGIHKEMVSQESGYQCLGGEVGTKLVVTLLFACRGEEALGNPHGALRRDGDTQLFF